MKFRIPLLMVLSQIVLTAFVVYWLLGQFNQEGQTLKKALLKEYNAAEDQAIDSILLKHIIKPALGDSIQIKLDVSQDSIGSSIKRIYKSKTPKKIIAIGFQNETDSQSTNTNSFHFTQIVKEDALKRSVKMIINHTDQFRGTNGNNQLFHFPVDTVLFKKIFSKSLNNKNFDFKLKWLVQNDSIKHEIGGITITGGIGDGIPAVNISRYTLYIFKKITPQLIFAIFLLGLSASAFFFTYLSLKKQIQLNTLRNDFVSNITHELKTPVATAKVALEALKTYNMKNDPKVANEYLNMVSMEMNRLNGLIIKVLDHSVLERESWVIHKEAVDLHVLVQNILNSMQIRFSTLKAEINFEPEKEPCIVKIDQLYIEGVIMNLLDNSLKYAAPNPKISISICSSSNSVLLSVSDNGPGIPKEYLSKIFDKFFRMPHGNRHNIKGYGLGLSFATLVMEHHNGQIYAENQEEGGCSFTLKFPKTIK